MTLLLWSLAVGAQVWVWQCVVYLQRVAQTRCPMVKCRQLDASIYLRFGRNVSHVTLSALKERTTPQPGSQVGNNLSLGALIASQVAISKLRALLMPREMALDMLPDICPSAVARPVVA